MLQLYKFITGLQLYTHVSQLYILYQGIAFEYNILDNHNRFDIIALTDNISYDPK